MSDEMKPVAWVNPDHLPDGAMPKTMPIISIVKWHSSTLPLYTADQLAEAVAKERERCAKLCERIVAMCNGLTKSVACLDLQAIREGASA